MASQKQILRVAQDDKRKQILRVAQDGKRKQIRRVDQDGMRMEPYPTPPNPTSEV